MLRPNPDIIPHCSSEELFHAPNASRWKSLVLKTAITIQSRSGSQTVVTNHQRPEGLFYGYAKLACISASILEARKLNSLDEISTDQFRRSLLEWLDHHDDAIIKTHDSFCLLILWHFAFIALYVDMNFLERSVGREGMNGVTGASDDSQRRLNDHDLQKGAMHAICILRLAEKLRLNVEPAIHVPHILFGAGLVIFCCCRASNIPREDLSGKSEIISAELHAVDYVACQIAGSAFHNVGQSETIEISAVYRVIDVLNRVGHWERSRKHAAILDYLMAAWCPVT